MTDAEGVVHHQWSGVSPKKYDADFVEEQKDLLRENFSGATIIGDNHYWAAAKKMRDPKFIATPTKKTTLEEARKVRFTTTAVDLPSVGPKPRRPGPA